MKKRGRERERPKEPSIKKYNQKAHISPQKNTENSFEGKVRQREGDLKKRPEEPSIKNFRDVATYVCWIKHTKEIYTTFKSCNSLPFWEEFNNIHI